MAGPVYGLILPILIWALAAAVMLSRDGQMQDSYFVHTLEPLLDYTWTGFTPPPHRERDYAARQYAEAAFSTNTQPDVKKT